MSGATTEPVVHSAALDAVCETARLLLANGHNTGGCIEAVEALGRAYDMPLTVMPHWAGLTLIDERGRQLRSVAVRPEGVNMRVVTTVTAAVTAACSTSTPPVAADLTCRLQDAAGRPPYPTWVFALACASGATALAVIFGAVRPSSFVLIPAAAALGGVVRRQLGRYGVLLPGQAFVAALIAGLAGSLSITLDVTSQARLVAVCPAMVLVPGPHLLNGALDVAARRMSIGLGRLLYGTVITVAISVGLLLGLSVGGSLPVTAASRMAPLWLDVLAAAAAAASYPIYFSLDARLIAWPVLAGALAHAVRWLAIVHLGAGTVTGAFAACLLAGALLAPISRRVHASFAGVGFAAVVALVPGVFVFRGVSGLFDLTRHPTAATVTFVAGDLSTAALTLLAMLTGLVLGSHLTRSIGDPMRLPIAGLGTHEREEGIESPSAAQPNG